MGGGRMEFYLLGMVLLPLALAAVGSVVERRLAEEDEEDEALPMSELRKAA